MGKQHATLETGAIDLRNEGPRLLECSSVSKRFGNRLAVDRVTFGISRGEIYGLLGPNGAGKTTTIKMVCGLLDPDSGSVFLGGREPREDLSAKGLAGYVPQEVALYPDLTAYENLAFIGRLYGLSGDRLKTSVDEALELTELSQRRDDRVESFSGGMKRRLNIAAGLIHHPSLLVLDEPTVGVDPQSRHAILDRVIELKKSGMSVLYTTHYMEEAQKLCDRIAIMDRGRIIAEGSPRELVGRLGEKDAIELSVSGDVNRLAQVYSAIPGIDQVVATDGSVRLLAEDGRSLLPSLIETSERTGVAINSVQIAEADLEAVFLHLTGTALRE